MSGAGGMSGEVRAALAGAAAGAALCACAAAAGAVLASRAHRASACARRADAPERQREASPPPPSPPRLPEPSPPATPARADGFVGVGALRRRVSPARPRLQLQGADPLSPLKRDSYISWDDYFMAVAFLSARRSKDPNKQVGACIVSKDKVIVGIGYNGFPRGCADEHLPWAKVAADGDPLKTKYPYVCHAEVNAVLNANSSVRDTTVYVSMFPCNECAKVMIQAGVKQVVFFEGKDGKSAKDAAIYAASRRLLAMAGVELRQHCPQEPIVLDFTLRCKKEQAPTAEEAILLSPVSPAPLPSGL